MFIAFPYLLYTDNKRDTRMNREQHTVSAHTQTIAGLPHQGLDLFNLRPLTESINRLGNISLHGWRELPRLAQGFGCPFDAVYKFL
jgi:hypothetical protein